MSLCLWVLVIILATMTVPEILHSGDSLSTRMYHDNHISHINGKTLGKSPEKKKKKLAVASHKKKK